MIFAPSESQVVCAIQTRLGLPDLDFVHTIVVCTVYIIVYFLSYSTLFKQHAMRVSYTTSSPHTITNVSHLYAHESRQIKYNEAMVLLPNPSPGPRMFVDDAF